MRAPKNPSGRKQSPRLRPLPHPADAPRGAGEPTPEPAVALHSAESLKCVWSHDGGCGTRIPENVVTKLWHHQMRLRETPEGFFHVTWRGGTWLAFGVSDGSVRGVYCPTHTAERAGRLEDSRAAAPIQAAAVT